MIREAVLSRTTQHIFNYLERHILLAGAESREEVLELLDSTRLLFPHWAIMTCPVMHPDLHYVSKNAALVFGYSWEYLKANSKIEKFFSHIHEDDQKDLYDCYSYLHKYLEAIHPEEHLTSRAVLNYRFRRADGQYMHIHDEKATLQLGGASKFYYALFQDLSERPFTGVKIEIFKQDPVLKKIVEYKPSASKTNLSKREQELVSLIRQGLSTKEIAWNLEISHHTVRNIKSKLFEKYNVSSSIELLNMTA